MTPRRRLFGSAGRWAGLALALAIAVIVAQALLVSADLQREAEIHREVIAAQSAKDGLDRLKLDIVEAMNAARIAALTGERPAVQDIERLAVDIDSELDYLGQALAGADPVGGYEAMAEATRLMALRARSIDGIRKSQGSDAAVAASAEVAGVAQRALAATRQVVAEQAKRLNERMVDRLGVVERIRAVLMWTFGGTVVVLLALFTAYRRARVSEADALRQVEWLAHWDTVTGLPNRTLLDDRLTQEIARAKRAGATFAIVMFDLDGFKRVNDTLGHAAGDRLLGLVGDRCRACIRASDTVGRLSGDEFLAILPESSLEGARDVAEKLRLAVAEPYPFDREPVRITTSLGIACFPAHGGEAAALKAAADAALYEAKRAGKNRMAVAQPSAAAPAQASEATA